MYELHYKDVYLDSAKKCVDAIWKYGLCRKGLSLCHGVSGNGYCFLKMYRVTKEEKYRRMAAVFAAFCVDERNIEILLNKPDRPWSMFEGVVGTCCYLNDFLCGEDGFPAYDIPKKWKTRESSVCTIK
jgi:lantibiotic modifying enzyme